ncbi:MAG: nicotinate-nucleotide adenylyltransferase [Bacteroidetes bacterium]|nr:nicotinate-nucleotide adenylyltransferase [Bacteroidota bacterium]
MNIGVYGGTFNPPHLGHLILAQSAIDALDLDRVLLVPAYQSPFKSPSESIAAELRAEMVELAVSDNEQLAGEYFEIRRKNVSFTVDTLRHLHDSHPDDTLFLLMGADTFAEFPLWKDPDIIADLAVPAVTQRPGYPVDFPGHPFEKAARSFSMPLIEISSTEIRKRIRQGRSINYLVPWAVRIFIDSQGLYREQE